MLRERIFLAYQRQRLRSPALRHIVEVVPGATRLHRFAFPRIRPHRVTIEAHGLHLTVDTRDAIVGAHLIRDGTWESYETALFLRSIEPGMVVVDIGANCGYYTLLAARAVGRDGRVIGFEPDPTNFELLKRNVEANGFADRVVVIAGAVSDHAGALALYRDAHNYGAHSLAAGNVTGSEQVIVPCMRLDEALDDHGVTDVDVLKMDIQGAEGSALRGAERVLAQPSLRVFTEFWPVGLRRLGTDPGEVLQILQGRFGFCLFRLDQQAERVVEMPNAEEVLRLAEQLGQIDLLLVKS